jgi:hypothetical protein
MKIVNFDCEINKRDAILNTKSLLCTLVEKSMKIKWKLSNKFDYPIVVLLISSSFDRELLLIHETWKHDNHHSALPSERYRDW